MYAKQNFAYYEWFNLEQRINKDKELTWKLLMTNLTIDTQYSFLLTFMWPAPAKYNCLQYIADHHLGLLHITYSELYVNYC